MLAQLTKQRFSCRADAEAALARLAAMLKETTAEAVEVLSCEH